MLFYHPLYFSLSKEALLFLLHFQKRERKEREKRKEQKERRKENLLPLQKEHLKKSCPSALGLQRREKQKD